MAFYENVFIARQDVSTVQVEQMAAQFAEIITAQGGEVLKTEIWGLKTLTYRIRKNRKGHYVLTNISAPAGAIAELERNLRLHEDVLRYLTVRVDELEEGPSAMVRNKDERGDRGDRGDRGGRGRRFEREDSIPQGVEA